jgi:hypothetical protein
VLQIQPNNIGAQNNLGQVLKQQGDLEGSAACYEHVLRFQPQSAEVLINMGTVRDAQKRSIEAIAYYKKAIEFAPTLSAGHYNLGNTLKDQGCLPEAIASYRRAIECDPHHAESHFALGMSLLTQSEWKEGWREYEWRWKTPHFTVPEFARSNVWDGSELGGRTILLYAEQGLGDTLQFIRYVPLVRERGGKVLVQCQPRLIPLLGGVIGTDCLVPRGQPLPRFDCAAALLSLPGIFGTTTETVPALTRLQADPERRSRWRQWLDHFPGRKVGICWQGNPHHPDDARRSVPLSVFAPLSKIEGIRLVSLQATDGLEQLAQHGEEFKITDAGLKADEHGEGLQELAAILSELDLVGTVDTFTAHLAGALGVEAWVALIFMPDWRWILDRSDTPWYPSLRFFRQEASREWRRVFERLAEAVREKFEGVNSSSGQLHQ